MENEKNNFDFENFENLQKVFHSFWTRANILGFYGNYWKTYTKSLKKIGLEFKKKISLSTLVHEKKKKLLIFENENSNLHFLKLFCSRGQGWYLLLKSSPIFDRFWYNFLKIGLEMFKK